jgi:hypothetical protein
MRAEDFEAFTRRRRVLNRKLQESAAGIDEWFEQHEHFDVIPLSHLASLEGLLSTRRSQLAQLIDLDEIFIDALLGASGRAG